MTRRIARRAWRLLRPGHTRPARTGRVATPPPEVIDDWRVPVWEARPVQMEDELRAGSEEKTRRLRRRPVGHARDCLCPGCQWPEHCGEEADDD